MVFQKTVKGFLCHCCVNPGLSQPDDFRAIAQSGIDFDKRTSSAILRVIPGDLIGQTPALSYPGSGFLGLEREEPEETSTILVP